MTQIFKSAFRAIISPNRLIRGMADLISVKKNDDASSTDKFHVDANGSVILNRNNMDVQKAFDANIAGLATKK
ncbi:hypothetical protein [Atlantibacter hermannii]|uniref:hypothetical protein n=1 Tax=Atlantibacter hermannii TaxID=565 RepID=UPI0028972F4B|nr:hypothetical protein [Atlantibacter hermannii]